MPSLLRRLSLALAISLGLAPAVEAAPMDIVLGFGSLPSAQGWTYVSTGVVAPEIPTWALSAGVLSYNTMAYLTNTSGTGTTSLYRRTGVISGTETVILEMRGRILQHESDGSAFIGGGFNFGMGTGTQGWQMGILPGQIRSINNVVLANIDNTQFHDYRMVWMPGPTVSFYVDNVLIAVNNGAFAGTPNQVVFGDGTGAANAQAEITYFRFRQGDLPTPAAAATWGRMKSLFR